MAFKKTSFAVTLLACISGLASADGNAVQGASFTWYDDCDPSHLPACGANAKTVVGTGYAATNRVNYQDGAQPVNGVGKGCGTCWHIQPQSDPYPPNGNTFGNATVVKINDECSDGGYCDQQVGSNGQPTGNTKYGKPLHFDLCTKSGVADAFFGNTQNFGNLLGLAQQVDCSELDNGKFGMNVPLLAPAASGGGQPGVTATGTAGASQPTGTNGATGTDDEGDECEL